MKNRIKLTTLLFLFSLNGMAEKNKKNVHPPKDVQKERLMQLVLYKQPKPPITSAGDRFAVVPYRHPHEVIGVSRNSYEHVHSTRDITSISKRYVDEYGQGNSIYHSDGSINDKKEFLEACDIATKALVEFNGTQENMLKSAQRDSRYRPIFETIGSIKTIAGIAGCIIVISQSIKYLTPQKRFFFSGILGLLSATFITKVITGMGLVLTSARGAYNWVYIRYLEHKQSQLGNIVKLLNPRLTKVEKRLDKDEREESQIVSALQTQIQLLEKRENETRLILEESFGGVKSELQETQEEVQKLRVTNSTLYKTLMESAERIQEMKGNVKGVLLLDEKLQTYNQYIDAILAQLSELERRENERYGIGPQKGKRGYPKKKKKSK